jgi:hypothetical protein
MNDKYLWKIIGTLKKSALKHRGDIRPGRRRSGLQRYLKDVYEIFVDFRSKRIANKATRRIAELLRLPVRDNTHPIRILIEASAGPEDNRAKSRWTQALKYAHGWLTLPDRLDWFFQLHGGISGTAAKLAVRDGTTRRGKNNGEARPILNSVENNPAGVSPQANDLT